MTAVLVSERCDKEYVLSGDSATLGRVPGNDIVIESSGVSRNQANITWTGSTYILKDLNSANGTWVNGKRLSKPTGLADGDIIDFGDVRLTFRLPDSGAVTIRVRVPEVTGFATILFTDIEGSTTLADRHGDAAAQEVRRAHNEIVRSALSANGGSEVKHTGDGIMASFAIASGALDCAIAIQRGVAAQKEEHPESLLGVYIGLNAGEPIAEGDPEGRIDLFGTSVDLAARLVDHAEPGQIIASDVVRQLAAGKDFLFADLGETELRGFEDLVKLWELRWQER